MKNLAIISASFILITVCALTGPNCRQLVQAADEGKTERSLAAPNLKDHTLSSWTHSKELKLDITFRLERFGEDTIPLVPITFHLQNLSMKKGISVYKELEYGFGLFNKGEITLSEKEFKKQCRFMQPDIGPGAFYLLVEAQKEFSKKVEDLVKIWSVHKRIERLIEPFKYKESARFQTFAVFSIGGRSGFEKFPFPGDNEYHVTGFYLFPNNINGEQKKLLYSIEDSEGGSWE